MYYQSRLLYLLIAVSAHTTSAQSSGCSYPKGTNLILNPGFEDNTSGSPWTLGAYDSNLTTPGYKSNTAYHPAHQPGTIVTTTLQQTIFNICIPTTYLLSFEYQFVRNDVDWMFNPIIGTLNERFGPPKGYKNKWLSYKALFQIFSTYEYDNAIFSISTTFSNGGGQGYFDDFNMQPVDASVVPGAANLITDPGFEQETGTHVTEPWESPLCKVVSPGYQSEQAVQCKPGHYDHGNHQLHQNVKTKVGTPYYVSFYYKVVYPSTNSNCLLGVHNNINFQFDNFNGYPGAIGSIPNDTWIHYEDYIITHLTQSALYITPAKLAVPKDQSCEFTFDTFEWREAKYTLA